MNILHIISSGGMYGAEAVILNLSRALNESGHRSIIGVFSNSANPNLQLLEAAKQEGIEAYAIPCKGQVDPAVPKRIRELAAGTHADVVHAHGYKADIYVWVALRGHGMPLVSTCHNWLDNGLAVRCYGILDRLTLRAYDAVAAVSEEVRQRLLTSGVEEKRIHSIRNGIDLKPFKTAAPTLREELGCGDSLLVGQIGRLSKEKGPDVFVRSAAKVLREAPHTRFIIAGDGPDREKLEQLVHHLGIAENLTLLGRRNDIPSVYASLDIVVSASRTEGLPMALLEAMASGRALVVTSVGDVPKVVADDRTALLVPPEDVDGLAVAILELLRNPPRRAKLGNAARILAQREYSSASMALSYVSLYRKVETDAHKGVSA